MWGFFGLFCLVGLFFVWFCFFFLKLFCLRECELNFWKELCHHSINWAVWNIWCPRLMHVAKWPLAEGACYSLVPSVNWTPKVQEKCSVTDEFTCGFKHFKITKAQIVWPAAQHLASLNVVLSSKQWMVLPQMTLCNVKQRMWDFAKSDTKCRKDCKCYLR